MPEGKALTVGFVGCGRHASTCILPCLRMVRVDLRAVCDLDAERAQLAARHFGATRWYSDHRQMLSSEELDAVFVVIGPEAHYTVGMDVVGAGLHLFTEKPPAASIAHARELASAALAAKLQYMPGFMKRFAPANRLLREAIARPEFGERPQYEARYTAQRYGTADAFALHHVVHHADLMRFFMGDVVWLHAHAAAARSGHFGYQALMGFAGGASGTLTVNCAESWGSPNERVAVVGEGHLALAENGVFTWHRIPPVRGLLGEPGLEDSRDALTWSQNLSWATLYSGRGYEGEVARFVECALSGEPTSPDGTDGVAAMQVLAAMRESVDTHRPVEVPAVDR
jgi:myo-inositol 2-dehydrogenase/D-chiro-inositol 1-dehydrogenase